MTDYSKEHGILMLHVASRSADCEDLGLPFREIGALEYRFTDSFGMISKKLPEDEEHEMMDVFQNAATSTIRSFITDFEYLLRSREGIENPADKREFGCSVWLEGNESMSITIDDEGIDDYLNEISAKEETRHITQFLKERAYRNGSVRCLKALQLVTMAVERQDR